MKINTLYKLLIVCVVGMVLLSFWTFYLVNFGGESSLMVIGIVPVILILSIIGSFLGLRIVTRTKSELGTISARGKIYIGLAWAYLATIFLFTLYALARNLTQ